MLERCAGKLARTVLRGGRGGNAASLPDNRSDFLVDRVKRNGRFGLRG
ncbi:MAG: hypothetical protein GY805_09625 [Chloroflexi bacterium]|nr:hypothetical protein [Chloroflexota bacterium]